MTDEGDGLGRGFVKLWRTAADHPMLNTAERLGAWAWILCKTQHEAYEWFPRRATRPILIPAGCVVLSVRRCAAAWGMSRKRVEGLLGAFRATKRPMLETVTETQFGTLYRVVRFDFWSGRESRGETPTTTHRGQVGDSKGTATGQVGDTKGPRIRREEGTSPTTRAREPNGVENSEPREASALKEYLGEFSEVVDAISAVVGHEAWAVDLWFRMRPQAQDLPQCPLGKLKPVEARPLVLAGALFAYLATIAGLEAPRFQPRYAVGFVRREVEGYLSDAEYDPRDRPRVGGEIDLEAWASKGD